ncbi:hypothetical protein [Candidatus Nanohalococcus occultus]|uniref:hypothetical protein n=1 Tax=Candidatus Nanohalococcus occultus TaxID=2978047 RepID=UPI0039DFB8FC
MSVSIRPTERELQEARRVVENTWKSFEYGIELEDPEIFLSWQSSDRASSLVSAHEEIMIALDPDKEFRGELRENVLIGVLEKEFRDKAPYSEIDFDWQEIAKMSYVRKRQLELTGEELPEHELTADWKLIRRAIDTEDEISEELYNNAGTVAAEIAKLKDSEEILEFTKSDVLSLGDEIFE